MDLHGSGGLLDDLEGPIEFGSIVEIVGIRIELIHLVSGIVGSAEFGIGLGRGWIAHPSIIKFDAVQTEEVRHDAHVVGVGIAGEAIDAAWEDDGELTHIGVLEHAIDWSLRGSSLELARIGERAVCGASINAGCGIGVVAWTWVIGEHRSGVLLLPADDSPPSTVIARSMSCVETKFISTSTAHFG